MAHDICNYAAVSDLTVTQERSLAVTFCEPITRIYNSFFVVNPEEEFNLLAYFEPLHYMSWIAIVAIVATAPVLLWMSARLEAGSV